MNLFFKVVGILASIFIVALIFNYPLMLALNYLFSPMFLAMVFGVGKITFWKAYILSVVARYIFVSGK